MPRVNNVNTTDILDAIQLGCRCMCMCLNADEDNFPFAGNTVRPHVTLRTSPPYIDIDNPGRFLHPLLAASSEFGVSVAEECIDSISRAVWLSYTGSLPLPLGRDRDEDHNLIDRCAPPIHMSPHNMREAFLALYSLIRYRDSDRARELAEATVETLLEVWGPDTDWDYDRLTRKFGLVIRHRSDLIPGIGRAIGPLTRVYRVTGYGRALELAITLKEKALDGYFVDDGEYDPEMMGTHGHSISAVMLGLAQLADLTSDSNLMNRVKAFYDNGLWDMRDELGWSAEDVAPESTDPDRGEANNTGEIAETAMILGRWGYTEYCADAERILRGFLLPSQLRDTSWIEEPPNPKCSDAKRDVANRLLGAWGFAAPYGHETVEIGLHKGRLKFNLDVLGGVAGSLCEVYREITRYDQMGHHVNLLFDHETDAIKVESCYTNATLRVTLKRPGPLYVRVPTWLNDVGLQVEGDAGGRLTNGYLLIPEPPINRPIAFDVPLPIQHVTLKHRSRDIRVRLRGDEVIAMDNFDADLTFFDPLD